MVRGPVLSGGQEDPCAVTPETGGPFHPRRERTWVRSTPSERTRLPGLREDQNVPLPWNSPVFPGSGSGGLSQPPNGPYIPDSSNECSPPATGGGGLAAALAIFLKIRIRAIDGGERTGDMKHKGDNATEGKRKRVRERDKG